MTGADLERDRVLCELGGILERERERRGLTVQAWSRSAGISKRAMRFRLLRVDPKLSTLIQAAAGLGKRLRVTVEPIERPAPERAERPR